MLAEKRDAIYSLVDTYKKMYGNDWHTHYQQALRDMAGIGSKLNPEECLMMKYHKPEPIPEPETITEPEPETDPEPETEPETEPEACPAEIKDLTLTYTRQGGDTWKELVRAFYPCLEDDYGMFGKDGAIRRLKKALSYDDNGNFNQQTYNALLRGGDLPKTMRLPKEIDGCERVDNAKVTKTRVQGNGKARIQSGGNHTFIATDGCDSRTATGSNRQEALNNLKAKTGKTYTNEAELLK